MNIRELKSSEIDVVSGGTTSSNYISYSTFPFEGESGKSGLYAAYLASIAENGGHIYAPYSGE
ncbi:hypothetical protein [Agaribacterium sp. ZY112]|uniref:hypothetical protein n=1 Tax=Agaribacterium sp. ZY112 TaxID=3233574 RepID=UPI0035241C35